MRKLWSVILLLLLIGGAGWFLWSGDRQSAAEEKHTVRIAYLPITHALPLFAEKELLTADDDVQVELIKYGSWPELMDALNTGKVDGASVLIELAVKAREQGIDVRAAALGHKDGNVIIGGNGIEKVEHEEEQPQIAQLYLKAKAKVVEMSLKLIRYDDLQITPEAYAELVKRMSAAKLIERIPEYEDFVDRTLLP